MHATPKKMALKNWQEWKQKCYNRKLKAYRKKIYQIKISGRINEKKPIRRTKNHHLWTRIPSNITIKK